MTRCLLPQLRRAARMLLTTGLLTSLVIGQAACVRQVAPLDFGTAATDAAGSRPAPQAASPAAHDAAGYADRRIGELRARVQPLFAAGEFERIRALLIESLSKPEDLQRDATHELQAWLLWTLAYVEMRRGDAEAALTSVARFERLLPLRIASGISARQALLIRIEIAQGRAAAHAALGDFVAADAALATVLDTIVSAPVVLAPQLIAPTQALAQASSMFSGPFSAQRTLALQQLACDLAQAAHGEHHPRTIDARYLFARYLLRFGAFGEAAKRLKALDDEMPSGPARAMVRIELSRALLHAGRFAEARTRVERLADDKALPPEIGLSARELLVSRATEFSPVW